MGGLGYMLGGALAGYGQGMAEVAKSAEEERKQIALENLRQQNQKAMQQSQYDLADRNNKRAAGYEADKTLEINEQQAGIQADRDRRQHGYDVKMQDIRGNQAESQARLQASLNAAADKDRLAFQAKLDSGQVQSVQESPDGYAIIYRDGRVEKTNIKPMPASTGTGLGGGGTLVEQLQASGGTAAPAAKPAAAPPPAPPRQARGQAPARPTGKTYTRAQAEAEAKRRGMSLAELNRAMKAAGYTMVN